MGVNNARILDIHYPDRNIAALLLHNDYAADFQKLLESKRVYFVNNFDPWDGSILKDPQYCEMTSHDRSLIKAAELQQQQSIDQLNASRYGQPADVFDIDDMDAIPDNYSHSFRDKM
ncbi:hypothetical protein INT46_005960 [Mucor plumbeus]|uniref:Uncharacterized protein n=1 Tax=Mucor plumbeus TaxID=97098 RepID=A0A8H7V581_9FUNG|nr:hypothetical protein INT46_005960 [Mucor plumbeus]